MDFLRLRAVLGLDSSEYESGLDKAKGIASSVGNGIKTAFGIGAKAIGAATVAVGAFAGASVKSYANYEQLVGGVSKLYGTAGQSIEEFAKSQGKTVDEVREKYNQLKEAEELMAQQSSEAFKTAGMSANQYMETATSFSAALINSLGGDTVAAAKMTDVAMQAISDNVNTFGSDVGSVTNAFQGFAKQNYTMLDNLKLGYGGTKEEMARLIDDANEYRASMGQTADLSMDSFADVVQAIQSVQEAQNIAGTTGREAMSTIEGSAAATKAAWQNVITAIGRGEGLSEALDGLTLAIFGDGSSDKGFLNNVIPRIETTMEGIGEFIGTAAPFITEKIPELVSSIVPSMLSAGVELLGALGEGFMNSIDTILFTIGDVAEMIMNAFLEGSKGSGAILDVIDWILGVFNENYANLINVGIEIITNIINGLAKGIPNVAITITDFIHNVVSRISESLPAIMKAVINILGALAKALIDNAPILLDAAINLIQGLVDGALEALPVLVEMIPTLIQSLVDAIIAAIPIVIDGVIQLVMGIVQALPTIITSLIEAIPQIIDALVNGFLTALPLLIEGWVQLVLAMVQALPQIMKALYDAIPTIIQTLADAAVTNLPLLIDGLVQMVSMIVANLPTIVMAIIQMIPELFKMAFDAIITSAPMIFEAFVSIWSTIGNTLMEYGANFVSSVNTFMSDMYNKFIEWLSQLPSQMAYWAGFAIASFIKFFMDLPENLKTWFNETKQKAVEFGTELKNEAYNTGKNFFNGVIDNIKQLPSRLQSLGNSLVSAVASLPSKFKEIGKNIVSGLWNGIQEKWQWLKDKVSELANSLLQGAKDALGVASPSKEFMYVGRMVDEGFAKGLDNFSYLISDAMDMITGNMLNVTPQVAFADGTTTTSAAGYNQTVNIYSPTALDPSETARQTRNATRDMILQLKGKK